MMNTLEFNPIGTEFNLEAYNKHGFFILKNALSSEETLEFKNYLPMFQKKIIDSGIKTPQTISDGKCGIQCEKLNDGSLDIRKVHNDILEYPRMLELYTRSKIMNVVHKLVGDEIYVHHTKYMCKPANGGVRKPWHQDLAYWHEQKREGLKMVTVWIALDQSTKENGCIQVVPGSHNILLDHYHVEDFMVDETLIKENEIVFAEMEPGDALYFHVKVLHASAKNNPRFGSLKL